MVGLERKSYDSAPKYFVLFMEKELFNSIQLSILGFFYFKEEMGPPINRQFATPARES